MPRFDDTLKAASLAILKRDLTEPERVEFLELGTAIGMSSVEDYLYMLMVFKRSEDRINGQITVFEKKMKARFDEIGALEKKIDVTLERSIGKILAEGGKSISYWMLNDIKTAAKELLGVTGDYHFLRGQVWVVSLASVLASMAYRLGVSDALRKERVVGFLGALFRIPASGILFVCGSLYTLLWAFDHWYWMKSRLPDNFIFILQIMVLLMLLFHLS